MIPIVIAFLMAAVNVPMALIASPSSAWFSWLCCGACAGFGLCQLMVLVMERRR
jgi:hypothetical protein